MELSYICFMKMLSRLLLFTVAIVCVYFVVDAISNGSKQNNPVFKNSTIQTSNVERNIEKENLELKMQFLTCKAHQ